MIELIERNIKIVIRTAFHISEKLEERLNMLSKDMKDILKRPKIGLLKLKIIMSEMKNTLDGINGRSGISEQKVNQFHKKKMKKKINRALMNCGTTSSGVTYMQLESLRQRRGSYRKYVKR